ncbi:Retrovirus-related Pol polyprotein from transposon 17.6, partial [Dictyocoela muelleri]
APREFQKCMNNLFSNLDFVKIFLDDMLIFSESIELHEKHLNNVLKILKKVGASINFEKSNFCQREVTYLGNIISEDGIKPDISRIDKLVNFKQPKSFKDVMKLVGFINWFRPYIKNISQKITPITHKLSQKNPFKWNYYDTKIIDSIYKDIKSQTLLSFPNYDDHFEITTDASDLGLGATISQNGKLIGL